jgi:hypothetical protein
MRWRRIPAVITAVTCVGMGGLRAAETQCPGSSCTVTIEPLDAMPITANFKALLGCCAVRGPKFPFPSPDAGVGTTVNPLVARNNNFALPSTSGRGSPFSLEGPSAQRLFWFGPARLNWNMLLSAYAAADQERKAVAERMREFRDKRWKPNAETFPNRWCTRWQDPVTTCVATLGGGRECRPRVSAETANWIDHWNGSVHCEEWDEGQIPEKCMIWTDGAETHVLPSYDPAKVAPRTLVIPNPMIMGCLATAN